MGRMRISDANPPLRKEQGWPGGGWEVAEAHFGVGVREESGGTAWVTFLCWNSKDSFLHFPSKAHDLHLFFPIKFYQ